MYTIEHERANEIVAKRRLKNAVAEFLSLVPRGANKLTTVYKEDGTFTLETLSKEAPNFDERGEILAVGYPSEMRDAQGHIASKQEVKNLCYSFAKLGNKLDLRHDGKAVTKDRAFVAENFLVAKGDARFQDWKDYEGNVADLTDAWAVVVKVDDPELRKLYKAGAWNGVSFGGRAELVVEQDDTTKSGEVPVTIEEMLKVLEANNKLLVTSLVKELRPEPPRAPEAKPDEIKAPIFKGAFTAANVRAHAHAVRVHKLMTSVEGGDPDALIALAKQLEDDAKAAEANETPEQTIERLRKENLALTTKVKKQDRASSTPPVDGNDGESAIPEGLTKGQADEIAAGKGIAAAAPMNSFLAAKK